MIGLAYELSETFNITGDAAAHHPGLSFPSGRVCWERFPASDREVKFEKDPSRWAATPRFRFHLHNEVEEKLAAMARHKPTQPLRLNPETVSSKAIVSSGVAAAHCKELIKGVGPVADDSLLPGAPAVSPAQ